MASYHTRSFSFPSKSHPVEAQLKEQLCRLSSSQAASTSSSLINNLTILVDLYKCVGEFLQLPQSQKIVSQTHWVEKILDGSLRLLDMCTTSRDVLVQSNEQLQDIQSVLRRKCSDELNMINEFAEYQQSRKSAKKLIKKCLKDMKQVDETNEANNSTLSMLKDVQAVTVVVFKSLLSYIGGSQKSSWSFSKKTTASIGSTFDVVDELISQKKKANVDMSQVVQLQTEVQEIDEVLQSLFRHLINTRATLLNVLSN